MIEVYKILTNKYDSNVNLNLQQSQNSTTRGHNLKIVNSRCHYDLRKYSFTVRIVNTLNSLQESVISARGASIPRKSLEQVPTPLPFSPPFAPPLPIPPLLRFPLEVGSPYCG